MIKKLALMGVILTVILIAAAMIAPYFIPADAFKRPIISKIEALTGRSVKIEGAFQIRFFPIAGVTMENVSLISPPRYGDTQPLMTLKSIDVDVAVIPLLRGSFEVRKLILDEPRLNLHVTKEGIKNWLPLQQAFQSERMRAVVPAAMPSMPLPKDLLLSDVKIKDGVVTYADEAAGTQWDIKKVNAGLSLNGLASPFTIDASGEWKDTPITIKGTLSTLQTFFYQGRTKIEAELESDLLSFSMDGFIERAIYTGKAGIKSPSLKAFMAWIDPAGKSLQTPAPLALNASGDVECAQTYCNLSNASFTLDKIQAKGGIKASRDGKPQIDLDLTTGMLDFNPFLSRPSAHAANGVLLSDAYAETGERWSDEAIDLSIFQAVSGTANIVADGIALGKITVGKNTLHARLQDGQLDASVADADMYGGKVNIAVKMDAVAPLPTLESRVAFKGVQVQPLLKDAADLNRLSGTAGINLNTAGQGKSEKAFIASLAGNGQFTMNNGAIKGIDLGDMIHNITSAYKTADSGAQKTPITEMKGSFTIAQGIVNNRDLTMISPSLHLSGQGDINLPAYSINYRLTPQMVQAADKTGAAKEGVGVPVIVEGNLDNPGFRPDLNAVAQEALKNPQQFKEQLKNTRESLKDQLKNPDTVKNLKDLLKGF